jgi:hypothetical protein
MKRGKIFLFGALTIALATLAIFHERAGIALAMAQKRFVKKTVKDRLAEFGGAARQRLAPHFTKAGVAYPPKNLAFVILKSEKRFELHGSDGNQMRFIRAYPVLAASGQLGPKLREGDRQVPEGIYEIESLNPNSAYHVSLRLNYPNSFDRAQAAKDGRTNLGGDIMIHGKSVSIGCIAPGDEAAEDMFTLAADVGIGNVSVIISPTDFRTHSNFPTPGDCPIWAMDLWLEIAGRLVALPAP